MVVSGLWRSGWVGDAEAKLASRAGPCSNTASMTTNTVPPNSTGNPHLARTQTDTDATPFTAGAQRSPFPPCSPAHADCPATRYDPSGLPLVAQHPQPVLFCPRHGSRCSRRIGKRMPSAPWSLLVLDGVQLLFF